MKATATFLVMILSGGIAHAETRTVDAATYTVPDGWQTAEQPRISVSHTQIDQAAGRYCQLHVWRSTASKGSLDADFATDWNDLVVANLGAVTPAAYPVGPRGSWQARGATGSLQGGKGSVFLVTFRNGTTRISFTAVTSAPAHYRQTIDAFFASIRLAGADAPTGPGAAPPPRPAAPATSVTGGKTVTFSDGWVATEQADWVEGRKGALTVRILHDLPDLRPFNNLDEATAFVWNRLVAPRYSGVSNLWVRRSFWADGGPFDGKYFAEADARAGGGASVHVALFKNGTYGRWIEIVTPDKVTFQRLLTTVVPQEGTQWDRLISLINLNRFPVTAADLVGAWGSSSGSQVQYVDAYTGNNAGMGYASSVSTWEFRKDGTYTSVWKGAHNAQNGQGTQFGGETSRGTYTVSDWEVTLTGRFKGATHTFVAQLEAVRGGRILHLMRGTVEEVHLIRKP